MLTRSLNRVPLRMTTSFQFSSEASADNIGDWMKKVSSKVSTPHGKTTVGQLTSLMTHYNKTPLSEESEINWDQWDSQIKTSNFVSNLKERFEFLNNQEYKTEGIMDTVKSQSSDAYSNMNNELQFHNDLWFEYHLSNKKNENDINDVGNLLDYKIEDLFDMMPKTKAFNNKLFETGNYLPGSHDDINFYTYLYTQFAWGKKMVSFYRHPEDDYRSLRATKNIIGQ